MNKTKRIGRAPDNDVVIEKNDISNYHAKIMLTDGEEVIVEDLNSTNGTFVNGYRVKKVTIGLKDEVRLSATVSLDLCKLFGLQTAEKISQKIDEKDYSREFQLLEKVWSDYQNEKLALQRKHTRKTTIIRASITLAPLFIWELFQHFYIANLHREGDFEAIRFWQNKYIVFSVLGSTLAMMATGSMSIADRLQQLDEDFRVQYVCPNPICRMQLGGVPWRSYHNQGKCFRCGAKYKL